MSKNIEVGPKTGQVFEARIKQASSLESADGLIVQQSLEVAKREGLFERNYPMERARYTKGIVS
jgi:hypothetical protein